VTNCDVCKKEIQHDDVTKCQCVVGLHNPNYPNVDTSIGNWDICDNCREDFLDNIYSYINNNLINPPQAYKESDK
jgi:hypothetical protein